jgi:hypothetical protein
MLSYSNLKAKSSWGGLDPPMAEGEAKGATGQRGSDDDGSTTLRLCAERSPELN